MSFRFFDLPQELQIRILQDCLPKDLARNLGNSTLNALSRDNQIWNQWLIKPVQLGNLGDAKAQFANHLDNITEEARPLHPLGLTYNELLAITQSSKMIMEKVPQIIEKCSSNPTYADVFFRFPIFWEAFLKPSYEIFEFIRIATSSSEAPVFFCQSDQLIDILAKSPDFPTYITSLAERFPKVFFQFDKLISIIAKSQDGLLDIVVIARSCHEAASVFFERNELVNDVLNYDLELIRCIAEKFPNVFLAQQQLVDHIREQFNEEEWIEEIQALAAQENEDATAEIPHTISRLNG